MRNAPFAPYPRVRPADAGRSARRSRGCCTPGDGWSVSQRCAAGGAGAGREMALPAGGEVEVREHVRFRARRAGRAAGPSGALRVAGRPCGLALRGSTLSRRPLPSRPVAMATTDAGRVYARRDAGQDRRRRHLAVGGRARRASAPDRRQRPGVRRRPDRSRLHAGRSTEVGAMPVVRLPRSRGRSSIRVCAAASSPTRPTRSPTTTRGDRLPPGRGHAEPAGHPGRSSRPPGRHDPRLDPR